MRNDGALVPSYLARQVAAFDAEFLPRGKVSDCTERTAAVGELAVSHGVGAIS